MRSFSRSGQRATLTAALDRRGFVRVLTSWMLGLDALSRITGAWEDRRMYGLIGKIVAVEGRRETLARILLDGTAGMPGCLSYVVAEDSEDDNALWVTEVWEDQEKHRASLSLPGVQAAIEQGRPLIAGFEDRHVTTPLGGQGIDDPDLHG